MAFGNLLTNTMKYTDWEIEQSQMAHYEQLQQYWAEEERRHYEAMYEQQYYEEMERLSTNYEIY